MNTQKFFSLLVILIFALLANAPNANAAKPKLKAPGPTQISECQIIDTPGSYVVVNNLPGPGGLLTGSGCLEVITDYVTIDLDGFNIDGAGSVGAAITADNIKAPTVIHDGSISNFETGIEVKTSSTSLVVDKVQIRCNSAVGVGVAGLVNTVVTNSMVTGCGVGMQASHASRFTDNVVHANTTHGILAGGSGVVLGNTVTNHAAIGIGATCPALVALNVATFNGVKNIDIVAACDLDANHNVAP